MTDTWAARSRVARRETHSPRSVVAIGIALVLLVVSLWLAVEIVLDLLGVSAWLASPASILSALILPPQLVSAVVLGIGVGAALVGILLVLTAVLPGRKSRRILTAADDRVLAIVDDEVIASALAREASRVARVDPDAVSVAVSRRASRVTLTPTSGSPVDSAAVRSAVDAKTESFGLSTALRTSISVAAHGKVGA